MRSTSMLFLVIATPIPKGARAKERSLDAQQVVKMSVARPAAVLATLEQKPSGWPLLLS